MTKAQVPIHIHMLEFRLGGRRRSDIDPVGVLQAARSLVSFVASSLLGEKGVKSSYDLDPSGRESN
ncbi:hypothetical protein GJ744_004591 [Endocarpon pusillum]|uniref:Uncharacterized protein n=1 Tax=Endocarpon pusillum TaxID=364733 RepID=A0A8H7AR19_9EURO|nr:hypothetical protein GJ744_004591 [Endocarpon pusillum]